MTNTNKNLVDAEKLSNAIIKLEKVILGGAISGAFKFMVQTSSNKVAMWRLNNYLTALEKSAAFIKEKNTDRRNENLPEYSHEFIYKFIDESSKSENDTIQEMWARLLAGRHYINTENSVSFIELIKQFSPNDALLFKTLCAHKNTPSSGGLHHLYTNDQLQLPYAIFKENEYENCTSLSVFQALFLIEVFTIDNTPVLTDNHKDDSDPRISNARARIPFNLSSLPDDLDIDPVYFSLLPRGRYLKSLLLLD